MKRVNAMILLFLTINILSEAQSYKPILHYASVRDADVMWSKHIWRVIDLKEKINQAFFFPLEGNETHISLFDALKKGVFSGKIQAFRDDEFNDE
ncbi:MAG TPA: hypothetical protein VNX68_07770, partial [Nitrosopumilaceae archaeon]|nr:hypothetical protein [Nitrosopumilaceae archaeon]